MAHPVLIFPYARFTYTCSKCGALASHRRESDDPQRSLGKFRCPVHGAVPIRRERATSARKRSPQK